MNKHPLALLIALAALALPLGAQELKWDATDLGPFHTGCFKINGQVTTEPARVRSLRGIRGDIGACECRKRLRTGEMDHDAL